MSRRRRCASFSRQRASSRRMRPACDAGSADQSGSRSRTAAIVSETVSPCERRAAGQHLVEHAAERPDVGPLVDGLPARLLGAHVGGGAEDDALAVRADGDRRRLREIGDRPIRRRSPSPGRSRAPSPTPSGVILMLAGFRSRWMMPRSCAASSASAIWRAIVERLAQRQRARARSARPACRPRPARAPARARRRRLRGHRWRRCAGWLSDASTRASRSKRASRSGIAR